MTGRSSDVENLREGVVRFASPRLPVTITSERPARPDIALSEENLDAHAQLRGRSARASSPSVTMQQGDLLGLRNQARYEATAAAAATGSRRPPVSSTTRSPRAGCGRWRRRAGPTRCRCACARRRDYSRLANQPMPDIDRLFDQVAAASAHLDAATLGRISAAFCWRFHAGAARPRGISAGTRILQEQLSPTKTRSCRSAKRPASRRALRSLWRDALRGSLLPFFPIHVKSGDLDDRPDYGLVRKCDTPLLEMHFYFRNRCCAHAVIERFGATPRPSSAARTRKFYIGFTVLFGCGGSIALECLRRLKSTPDKFDAALACLTSEERLPCLTEGDSVLVAPACGRSIAYHSPVGARSVHADVVGC